jgi:hypothetical protein
VAPVAANFALRAHPIHIAVCELRSDAATGMLQISLRIFTDDLARALDGHAGRPLRIDSPREDAEMQAIAMAYARAHVQIKQGGRPSPFSYVGREYVQEATWLHFEAPLQTGAIEVRSTILLEVYRDQATIVNWLLPTGTRSLRLYGGATTGLLSAS